MKVSAFVLFILISEKAFCIEPEPFKDEAVFQGKCGSNLCSQLCYELHDGMFECDCTHGYELNLDGYTCTPNNISNNLSSNESKLDDDYGSSDVFYQKGVSFSAKLEESTAENTSNKITNNEIDNQSRNLSNEIRIDNKILINVEPHEAKSLSSVSLNIPRFHQSSWIAFRPLKGANLVTEISLEFRPEQLSGILLLSGERDDLNGDFMIVTLSNGFVELFFDCGSGKGVIKSGDKVVLHQWNTLTIYRYRWDAWIELNDKRRVRGRSIGIFSRITFRSALFLGGKGNLTTETLMKKKIHSYKGFSGCIRKFVVNGHQYELSKLSSNEIISTSSLDECTIDQCSFVKCVHGGRCQSASASCLCPLGFGGNFCEKKLNLKVPMFNGTSYLRYSPLGDSAIIWLELKLVIKPQNENGLLLFSGKNDLGDFIALYLNFGFVEFHYDLGSGLTVLRSKFSISLNQWHTIKISRTARLAVMKIDTQPESMTISPNGFWHLSLPFNLYLGGISKSSLLPTNLRERGMFVGCITQFEVNDRAIYMIDDALGGYNIENCNEPTPNEATSSIEIFHDKKQEKSKNKFVVDVVDDSSDQNEATSVHIAEKKEYVNASNDDPIHKRIVRVSLQKTATKNQGACFKGNETYALYDLRKIVRPTENNHNDINIRFKTLSPNGLMFLIMPSNYDSYISLSIEDGFMHLRYNQASTHIDIVFNDTTVNDGLWHRVRALRRNLKGSLRIDGSRSVTARTRAKQKFFKVSPGLYLGDTGFIGCISDVILNPEDDEHHLNLNMFRSEESQDVNSEGSL